MPWAVAVGMIGCIGTSGKPTVVAPYKQLNCANCGAADEGHERCTYCKTKIRANTAEVISELESAQAIAVARNPNQAEWAKGTTETMVAAFMVPSLINQIVEGLPGALTEATAPWSNSSDGGGDFSGGGASGDY